MTTQNLEEIEVSPEQILQTIQSGAAVYSQVTSSFIQDFVFYDKTLYEWTNHLMIDIPEAKDLDEIQFRSLLVKLATNTQKASNYYTLANSMSNAIAGGNSIKKSDVINAIVLNFQARGATRPAATVIERMAESYMSSTVSARVAAGIVKSFWKERLDTLEKMRKILEQIGMSLHVELKWTAQ